MNADEIRREIAEGRIGAITLDTSSFGNPTEMSLEYGLYRRLEQFRRSDVRFVLSDVVANELLAHLTKGAHDAQVAATKALKQVGNAWQISRAQRERAVTVLFGETTAEMCAKARLESFVERTGAVTTRAANSVDSGELVRRYFGRLPPFASAKESKKNEFPDALALISLDVWAKEAGTKVLVVSKDGDWISYCEDSERLVSVKELAQALSYFHSDASVVCNMLSLNMHDGKYPELKNAIEHSIQSYIEGVDFIPEADAAYYFEDEVIEVSIQSVQFTDGTEENATLRPVEVTDERLVAEIPVVVHVEVTSDFSFSVKDGIDKDYVPIGSSSATRTVRLNVNVLVTFDRENPDDPAIEDIEVTGPSRYDVAYGYVEPDYE